MRLFVLIIATIVVSCSCALQVNQKSATLQHPIKIAIIDTGWRIPDSDFTGPRLKLCQTGHFDYDSHTNTIGNAHPHGTVVGSIIADELKDIDYCAVIYQIYHDRNIEPTDIADAIRRAIKENAKIINISLVGRDLNMRERSAFLALKRAKGIAFVVAGNESQNLTNSCNAYPACHKLSSIVSVGAMDSDGLTRADYSNYGGPVNTWYRGDIVWFGKPLYGTSYATPRALAAYVKRLVQTTPLRQ